MPYKNPADARAYEKAWREANPGKAAEYDQRHREKDPERARAKTRRYRAKHPEKVRLSHAEESRRWREANPEKAKDLERKYRYGLTPEAYAALVSEHAGRCAICGVEPKRLCIDHDHTTGKVRGMLCDSCNVRVGWIEKDGLDAVLAYLGRERP